MARTSINISEVINTSSKGNSAKSTVSSVAAGIGRTGSRIDSKILNRNNIRARLNNAQNEVKRIENDIAEICTLVCSAALKYQNTEDWVIGYARMFVNGSVAQKNINNAEGKYAAYFRESELSKLYTADTKLSVKSVTSLLTILEEKIAGIIEETKTAGKALTWMEEDWGAVKGILKKNTKLNVICETIKYTFEKGIDRSEEMNRELLRQMKEGDILGVLLDGTDGFIDTVIGGSIEILGNVGGSALDTAIDGIPVVKGINKLVESGTGLLGWNGGDGYSLGGLIDVGAEKISDGIDIAADFITDAVKMEIAEIPEDVKSAGKALTWMEETYEKLPDPLTHGIDVLIPSSLQTAYTLTSSIFQSDLTSEDAWDAVTSILKENTKLDAVCETINYTFEKGVARSEEMNRELLGQMSEGDILGALIDGTEGFIDTVIGGSVEVLGDIGGNALDTAIDNIPVVKSINKFTEYGTGLLGWNDGDGYSIGGLIGATTEKISDGIDVVTDFVTAGTDIVTDAITDGIKGGINWVKSWFD